MEWNNHSGMFVKAGKGSSIAVVDWVDANGPHHRSIFYQDPKLHLREILYDFPLGRWVYSESVLVICPPIDDTHQIVLGDFSPGVQPRGTPISAEVVHGGNVDINVTWRDSHGSAMSSSWSTSSGWDVPNGPSDGNQLLHGPARSVYIAFYDIKHLSNMK